jgi:hypothetical protein
MKRLAGARALGVGSLLAVGCCAAWAAGTTLKASLDGVTISTDIRMIDGRPYIPLGDAAKAMEMSVVKKGDTYGLVRAGGANQLAGITGKLAADIPSRDWIFKVISAEQLTDYTRLHGADRQPIALQQAGDVLVIVQCRLVNRTNTTQEVSFDTYSAGNTAVTDDQRHGFVPLAYDSRSPNSATKMLPGAAHEFALIFSVPSGTTVKDLIYTVGVSDQDKPTNFRVSLKP